MRRDHHTRYIQHPIAYNLATWWKDVSVVATKPILVINAGAILVSYSAFESRTFAFSFTDMLSCRATLMRHEYGYKDTPTPRSATG